MCGGLSFFTVLVCIFLVTSQQYKCLSYDLELPRPKCLYCLAEHIKYINDVQLADKLRVSHMLCESTVWCYTNYVQCIIYAKLVGTLIYICICSEINYISIPYLLFLFLGAIAPCEVLDSTPAKV